MKTETQCPSPKNVRQKGRGIYEKGRVRESPRKREAKDKQRMRRASLC